ncbi:ATP-dependent DNA ligase [Actinoplanes auranticolor]|uniref:ATP-dependent DNA ligase n=1 Tax=Actinoplanes auranticolor TaxID=47988 RepID=UPI001BB327CE|nr:hypothetical protein [Actinoplanes auranticolor]
MRETLPPGTVVDGELVVWGTKTGRTVFPALLGRITAGRRLSREAAARPASLVLFDVLADAELELTGRPLRQRRARLEDLLVGAPAALAVCPQTLDVDLARGCFDELVVTGVEGLVVKDLDGLYRPGRVGWWKLKRRVTTEAIIGGIIGAVDDPRVLLLGRLDAWGRLRYVARTVPLTLSQQQGDRPNAHCGRR